MLFITALCAIYQLKEWKQLLVLVTAFTVGHSITLALATLDIITINAELVEFLIPITIFLTSVVNVFPMVRATWRDESRNGEWVSKYFLALGFGLIHGMGFSNFLRAMLGAADSIVVPLLAFNIGLELGQILILICVLLLSTFMIKGIRLAPRDWGLLLSGATAGISFLMIVEAIIG